MSDKLLLIIPSRGRPEKAWSLYPVLKASKFDFLFCVDVDDDRKGEYPNGCVFDYNLKFNYVEWMNFMCDWFVPKVGYKYVGNINDDMMPRSPGWDDEILKALEDYPMVYANDLVNPDPRVGVPPGKRMSTQIFMRSDITKALGFMVPPDLKHFADIYWWKLGNRIGMKYLEDVIIEHEHWSLGKGPKDRLYTLNDSYLEDDWKVMNAYDIEKDIECLKSASILP